MTEKDLYKVESNGLGKVSSSKVSLATMSSVHTTEEYKVYKKRWIMLFLFSVTSLANAFHWVQYSIIVNSIKTYYGVSSFAVDCLSMSYMLTYIFLLVPGEILQTKGLRLVVLLGSLGTTSGAWIKVGSLSPDRYYVTFIGQTIVAISQIFIVGIPPRLAAVWFGPDQVSTACSIGVFGNLVGVAAGFLIPPMLVKDSSDINTIESGLTLLFYIVACFDTFLSILVIFGFRNEPPSPPSSARAAAIEEIVSLKRSLINLVKSRSFVLLFLSYGILVGVFNAMSTLLSGMILPHFPNHEKDAGRIGLCIVLFGMLGSVLCGIWLDKTKKYRLSVLLFYILTLVGLIIFALTLMIPYIAVTYVTASILGFFMTGYLPLGFEYASELTYPEPESTSSGLLNVSNNLFGMILTVIGRQILQHFGDLYTNIAFAAFLLLGIVLTVLINGDLKRQEVQKAGVKSASSIQVLTCP